MYFMKINHLDIIAVVVTYKPLVYQFKEILQRHKVNFNKIILVNNSPEISLESLKSSQVLIINNKTNIGLAAALNKGIFEAKKIGCKMIALFDQDTRLESNFVKKMSQSINNYKSLKPVAVYSPVYHNHIINETAKHISFKPFRLIRQSVSENKSAQPYYVITSGSFIPCDVFEDIGLMREELFIDFVDIDWCLRARTKGYEIVAFNRVLIDHFLGDYSVNFLGHKYPIHSPLRMYYYFRNSIYLYRLKEIELNWRFVDATRNIFRFIFYMLLVKNRFIYLKYIMKGYYHGLIKNMGRLDE